MKVVVCRECGDWVKLRSIGRSCACGRSGGVYIREDELDRKISSVEDLQGYLMEEQIFVKVYGPCIVVAIKNSEFPHKGEGTWKILDPKDPESHVTFEPSSAGQPKGTSEPP